MSEDGRRYVRHSLLDFGTTLGGGPGGTKPLWPGQERILEPGPILLSTLTLGVPDTSPTWTVIPDDPSSPDSIQSTSAASSEGE